MQLCIIATEILSNLINPDKMTKRIQTKGIQIEDHEIKIVNFADDAIIFL